MSLATIQRSFWNAVRQPLTWSQTMRSHFPNGSSTRKLADRFISPSDRMTSFERLEIYNRSYWFRLLSSFYEDFPGLRAVLGNSKFENLAVAYLSANPSASFTLRDLGWNLESWMRAHPKWLGDHRQLALDMVRLEWAEIETFDSREEEPLSIEHAQGLHGQTIIRLQPYLRLLDLRYPVDDMLIAIRKSNDFDGTAASNAVDNIRPLPRTRGRHKTKPENIYLAVHRQDHSVYFKRMEKLSWKPTSK